MRAIVYVRVSTEEQARRGYSLDAQKEACSARAKALGASEVRIFADEGVLGEVLERPGLQAAMEAVRGGAELFVCLDPDRLSRKLAHQLVITEHIERTGCRLEFINFEWKDTPEGRLFYSLRGAIAEYEKEKIKSRSRLGKVAKAKRGEKTHHLATYGYREEPGRLVIDEKQASVVRQMFEWAAAGDGPFIIATRLNEAGVPSPKGGKWYRGVVGRILKNPAYYGTIYLNRFDCTGMLSNKYRPPGQKLKKRQRPREEWIPYKVPPIIDRALWHRAQVARGCRRKMINDDFLLSGIVACGSCGLSMWGTSYKKANGKRYRYYLCASKKSSMDMKAVPECQNGFVRADELEDTVWGAVTNWLSRPEGLLEELRSPEKVKIVGAEIEEKARRLAELDRERKRAYSAFARGWVDEALYEEKAREIESRREQLTRQLADLQREMERAAVTKADLRALEDLTLEYVDKLPRLGFAEKSRLVHLLVQQVRVFPSKVEITGRVPEEARRYRSMLGETPIVVGDPVESPDGTVIIPVSRVTFGFAAGGGEYEGETDGNRGRTAEEGSGFPFGGGSGAGVTVQPVGFLVVGKGLVRLLPVDGTAVYDRLLDLAPQLIGQLRSLLHSREREEERLEERALRE